MSSEKQSWFVAYILNGMYRAQVFGVDSWWVLAESYLGTVFRLGWCCTRAPDLARIQVGSLILGRLLWNEKL